MAQNNVWEVISSFLGYGSMPCKCEPAVKIYQCHSKFPRFFQKCSTVMIEHARQNKKKLYCMVGQSPFVLTGLG